MPVFYLLHELFNAFKVNEDHEGNTEHGKRNSKLFILGSFIWIVIFVLVANLKMGYSGSSKLWMDSLFYGLFALVVVDVIVMAYIYKSYFGRNLRWEMEDPDIAEKKFDYDEETEKYTRNRSREIVEDTNVKITKNIANSAVDMVKKEDLRRHARTVLEQERVRLEELREEHKDALDEPLQTETILEQIATEENDVIN